jgi:PEP-CTERM motif
MGKMNRQFVLAAAVLGTMAVATGRARADLVLELVAAPGVDLANITVGQTFQIDLIAEGSKHGERLATESGGVLFFSPNLESTSIVLDPHYDATNLTTSPVFFDITFTALAAGPASLIEDFSKGTITTNDASYSPVSKELDLTVLPAVIAVPEPSTLFVIALAVPLGIGWWLRRRRRPA